MLVKVFLRSAASFSRPGKCSPRARQGFPAWENVPHERGKVSPLGKTFPTSAARFSRLGKCSSETEQGFPAWENVPRKPSKLFPPGKMFLGNRARFSRLGKCSSETEQAFPAWENVPRKPSKLSPNSWASPSFAFRFLFLVYSRKMITLRIQSIIPLLRERESIDPSRIGKTHDT